MTATTNAMPAEPLVERWQPTGRLPQPAAGAGSIEVLGRRLLEETNAVRCVAYRRNATGQLVWQHEVAADEAEAPNGSTLAHRVEASRRAPVQITEPVRDAFGEIIGVIQTREASDPSF